MAIQHKMMAVFAMVTMTVNMAGMNPGNEAQATDNTEHRFKRYAQYLQYRDSIPTHAFADQYDVIYKSPSGKIYRRTGGSRAWRNNNPGCIRYGDFSRNAGAIGHAGGFAVFPDEETGMNAICSLLKTDKYSHKTICSAVSSYAPPFENNTHSYQQQLLQQTGLASNTVVGSLDEGQIKKVASAIRCIEGWKIGTETMSAQKDIAANTLKFTYQKIR